LKEALFVVSLNWLDTTENKEEDKTLSVPCHTISRHKTIVATVHERSEVEVYPKTKQKLIQLLNCFFGTKQRLMFHIYAMPPNSKGDEKKKATGSSTSNLKEALFVRVTEFVVLVCSMPFNFSPQDACSNHISQVFTNFKLEYL
jgi:hypothetical protein